MKPLLIDSLEDIQSHIPVSMTSSFNTVAPFLAAAERTYIRRLLGKAQFDALVLAFQVGNNGSPLYMAIEICQKIIANLGYYQAITVLSVNIDDSGIHINSSETSKNAFQWQTEDLKDALIELGCAGIEELLEHIEEYEAEFSEFLESSEFRLLNGCLINRAADFTLHYDIDGSRFVFNCLQPILRRVEAQTMVKLFGVEFYTRLKGSALTDKEQYLVDYFLKPGLALLTASKAFVERVITLKDGKVAFNFKGNYNNIKESMPATRDQVQELKLQLENDGGQFIADGIEYIVSNAGFFPDYLPPITRRRARFKNDPDKGVFGI